MLCFVLLLFDKAVSVRKKLFVAVIPLQEGGNNPRFVSPEYPVCYSSLIDQIWLLATEGAPWFYGAFDEFLLESETKVKNF